MIDLVALVPCQPYQMALEGLFSRPNALNIRNISYDIIVHPERDAGCRKKSVPILRPFLDMYDFALVLFDLEGCGSENFTREQIEIKVENQLTRNGWANRASAIVVDPEIEIWVWSDSPHVDDVLDWRDRHPDVRTWLTQCTTFWKPGHQKPIRPKEAMERALREVQKPPSSSLFKELAEKVSVNRCTDNAFDKLKNTLFNWFDD